MLPRAAIIGALILSASCNKTESGDIIGSAPSSGSGSSTKPGSGGGFSADLARELGSGGSASAAGSAGPPRVVGGDPPKAGNVAPRVGSDAVAMAGNVAPPDPAAKAGAEVAKRGGDAVTTTERAARPEAKPEAKPDPAGKPGGDAAAMTGRAARPEAKTEVKPDPRPPPNAGTPASAPGTLPEAHGPVKVPADLAAIKLSLLPNWERDIDEAGTFQYVVRIKGTQNTKTFSFRYGYDDPKAPSDRDQYKKYLQDAKLLLGEIKDRQRGAAWFLEGTDASGLPAFRYLVLYGGKHLICYGSLYKDADGNRLGDDRDQTVIQAKQICETLAL